MRSAIFEIIHRFHCLLRSENGQDLVEYALVVALVAFGAVAGMHTLASGLSGMFTKINTALSVI